MERLSDTICSFTTTRSEKPYECLAVPFTVELSASKRKYNISTPFRRDNGQIVGSVNYLCLLQVTLGADASRKERNVIEIRSKGSDGRIRSHPIASLCVGLQEMADIDFQLDLVEPITLQLVAGTGGVVVTGRHEILYPVRPPRLMRDTPTNTVCNSKTSSWRQVNNKHLTSRKRSRASMSPTTSDSSTDVVKVQDLRLKIEMVQNARKRIKLNRSFSTTEAVMD